MLFAPSAHQRFGPQVTAGAADLSPGHSPPINFCSNHRYLNETYTMEQHQVWWETESASLGLSPHLKQRV